MTNKRSFVLINIFNLSFIYNVLMCYTYNITFFLKLKIKNKIFYKSSLKKILILKLLSKRGGLFFKNFKISKRFEIIY